MSLYSSAQTKSDGEARWAIKVAKGTDKGRIAFPEELTLVFDEAVVNTGLVEGLTLVFKTRLKDSSIFFLRFYFPSAATFTTTVIADSVEVMHAKAPFELTAADFANIYSSDSSFELVAKIFIEKESLLAEDAGRPLKYEFSTFLVRLTMAEFQPDRFSIKGSFKGAPDSFYEEAVDLKYTISGDFTITNGTYTVSWIEP